MSWHLATSVWGEDFVRRFAALVVPFLGMAQNVPALARDDKVVFHVYTDDASRTALAGALAPLAAWCVPDIRPFDAAAARGLAGAEYKYALQRAFLRDLSIRAGADEPIVLLDSNFVLADGTLAALRVRRRQGYRVVCVSVLRVARDPFAAAAMPLLARGAEILPRELVALSLPALHHITRAFFLDADPFTPYPSQLSCEVGAQGFANRNLLPHPLMVPASAALARAQSTMDYDLALRSASDREIFMCGDSDEALVVKFTDEDHHAAREGGLHPTPQDIGMFLLTATNRRHRLFAQTPATFHSGGADAGYRAANATLRALLDAAYAWIDDIARQPGRLDAKTLMYAKSHFGPIEDFLSPQLESAALARLA